MKRKSINQMQLQEGLLSLVQWIMARTRIAPDLAALDLERLEKVCCNYIALGGISGITWLEMACNN